MVGGEKLHIFCAAVSLHQSQKRGKRGDNHKKLLEELGALREWCGGGVVVWCKNSSVVMCRDVLCCVCCVCCVSRRFLSCVVFSCLVFGCVVLT